MIGTRDRWRKRRVHCPTDKSGCLLTERERERKTANVIGEEKKVIGRL